MWSQMCLLYVRTGAPDSKQRGISVLILDMATPGIDVRPLRQATGGADFAEVFFTDVVVPQENLVGEMNDGWRVTMGSLAHERAGLWLEWVGALDHVFRRMVDQARAKGALDDQTVRRTLVARYEEVAGLRALGYKGFASYEKSGAAPEHAAAQAGDVRAAQAPRPARLRDRPVAREPPRAARHLLGHDRRRHVGDPAQRDRPPRARPAAGVLMRPSP